MNDSQHPQLKIVVIGAGLAGLTTAYRLIQKNLDVKLYEARSRVGGRILTAIIDGHIGELGGQNITDGGKAENIYRLIQEFSLELKEYTISLNQSYFDGEQFIPLNKLLNDKQFDPQELRIQLDQLAQTASNMRDVLSGILDPQEYLYKAMAVRLAGYEGATIEKLSPIYIETLYSMLLGGISTAHLGNEDNSIDFVSLRDGNAKLPEKMAALLGERLILNKELKQLFKTPQGTYNLAFEDGDRFEADIVVLALPCSVYEDIQFDEKALPLETLKHIKKIEYGLNAKILLPISESCLKSTGFINDRMGCFSANRLLLTFYYTGIASSFTKETILDTYLKERTMLEKGIGETCPPFIPPTLAKDRSFETYEGPVGYSWPNDPYVKGSYSYIAPGQETTLTAIHEVRGEKVKTLFSPIDHTLYFAGEHASILTDVPGTMEAACESGERTARMILASLKIV